MKSTTSNRAKWSYLQLDKRSLHKESLEEELLEAARIGDSLKVKDLLDKGVNVNYADSDGQTPLLKAAKWSADPKTIKTLLKGGAEDIVDTNGNTAISLISERRHLLSMNQSELLRISPEGLNQERKKMLGTLAKNRETSALILLHYGFKNGIQHASDKAESEANQAMLDIISSDESRNQYLQEKLLYSIVSEQEGYKKILLDHGAKLEELDFNRENKNGLTPLMDLVKKNKWREVYKLIEFAKANNLDEVDIAKRNASGKSAFSFIDDEHKKHSLNYLVKEMLQQSTPPEILPKELNKKLIPELSDENLAKLSRYSEFGTDKLIDRLNVLEGISGSEKNIKKEYREEHRKLLKNIITKIAYNFLEGRDNVSKEEEGFLLRKRFKEDLLNNFESLTGVKPLNNEDLSEWILEARNKLISRILEESSLGIPKKLQEFKLDKDLNKENFNELYFRTKHKEFTKKITSVLGSVDEIIRFLGDGLNPFEEVSFSPLEKNFLNYVNKKSLTLHTAEALKEKFMEVSEKISDIDPTSNNLDLQSEEISEINLLNPLPSYNVNKIKSLQSLSLEKMAKLDLTEVASKLLDYATLKINDSEKTPQTVVGSPVLEERQKVGFGKDGAY